jgi:hypothetical protein
MPAGIQHLPLILPFTAKSGVKIYFTYWLHFSNRGYQYKSSFKYSISSEKTAAEAATTTITGYAIIQIQYLSLA